MCCIANSTFNTWCHTSSHANSLKLGVTSDALWDHLKVVSFPLERVHATNKSNKIQIYLILGTSVKYKLRKNMGFLLKIIGTQVNRPPCAPWFTNAPSHPLGLKVLHLHFAPGLTNVIESSMVFTSTEITKNFERFIDLHRSSNFRRVPTIIWVWNQFFFSFLLCGFNLRKTTKMTSRPMSLQHLEQGLPLQTVVRASFVP